MFSSLIKAISGGAQAGFHPYHGTVVFLEENRPSGIRGPIDPDTLLAFHLDYCREIGQGIIDGGGSIIQIVNRTIIAIWGWPHSSDNHAVDSAMTAVELVNIHAELQQPLVKRGLPATSLSVGLFSGTPLVGWAGPQDALQLQLIGDTPTVAERFMRMAHDVCGGVTVEESTWNQVREYAVGRVLGLLPSAGSRKPMRIYRVEHEKGSEPPGYGELLHQYNKGFDSYLQRSFREAGAVFAGILDKHPADGPSIRMMEACHLLEENPPPETWDGTLPLTQK